MTVRLLLDERVGRVFEQLVRERGFDVVHATDEFGEGTADEQLLRWCAEKEAVVVSNDARDFRELDEVFEHHGVFLYHDQRLPDDDPEGLAQTVVVVLEQYGADGVSNELVDLGEWYDWLHR